MTGRDVTTWKHYDEITGLELQVQLLDGDATVILGPRGYRALMINLLDDELVELHQAIGEEIARNAAGFAEVEQAPNPVIKLNVHVTPHGNQMFWVETPLKVHRASCSQIGPHTGLLMDAEKLIGLLTRTNLEVTTCAECAPFGRATEPDSLREPWIYHRDALSQAAHRLNIVAASELAKAVRQPGIDVVAEGRDGQRIYMITDEGGDLGTVHAQHCATVDTTTTYVVYMRHADVLRRLASTTPMRICPTCQPLDNQEMKRS